MKLIKQFKAADFSGAARLWGNSRGYVVTTSGRAQFETNRLDAERLFRQSCEALRKERDELVAAFHDAYLERPDRFEALFRSRELVEEMNRLDLTPGEMVERLRK